MEQRVSTFPSYVAIETQRMHVNLSEYLVELMACYKVLKMDSLLKAMAMLCTPISLPCPV